MATAEELIATRYAQPSKVYFMAGQSNMQGRAVDGTSHTNRANDATIYEYENTEWGVRKTFTERYPSGGTIVNFGPDVGLMRTLRAAGEEENYVIRFGAGGHSVTSFLPADQRELDPTTTIPFGNSDQSTSIINFFNRATGDMLLRHFRSVGESVFVWYQGAADSKNISGFQPALANDYGTHLTRLIAHLKGSVTELKGSSPVVVIRSPDWNANTPSSKPYQDVVRAAQVSVAEADPTAQWLTSDINQGVATTWEDASHIDAASQERLGMDLAGIVSQKSPFFNVFSFTLT
jgi:hypothetical protein